MRISDKPIPVILDTDIGTDIDDTWALAMLLKSPEVDLRLVVTDTGDTDYRARIVARMLETAGRADIPVGVGLPFAMQGRRTQDEWVRDYTLEDYPGIVHRNGVDALVGAIMDSPVPVTLLCIGPVPNIAEALRREPRIAGKARFVGMHGSIRKGCLGGPVSPEYNVANHTPDCQKVFSAPWDKTITPLDTCGSVVLQGDKYRRVRACADATVRALMENYRVWLAAQQQPAESLESRSSILFDTVAVYLAFASDLLIMEDLRIRVTDDGYTRVDNSGSLVHVAAEWRDLPAYEDFLVERLVSAVTQGNRSDRSV